MSNPLSFELVNTSGLPEKAPMSISLDLESPTPQKWDEGLTTAEKSGLQQCWAYGEAIADFGHGVKRMFIHQDMRLVGVCQLLTYRVPPGLAQIHLALRGPIWMPDVDTDTKAQTCSLLRKQHSWLRRDFLLLQPESTEEDYLTKIGMHKVMTGYATAWLDIRRDQDTIKSAMDAKWRNKLAKLKKTSSLRVEITQGGRLLDHLLDENDKQQKRRGFWGPPGDFVRKFIQALPKQDILLVTALERNTPIASQLFIRHGAAATYYIGWSDDTGRKNHAHNLLLWEAIGQLAQTGTAWLDMGGIDTQQGAGFARFKLGTGAEPQVFAGTFF